jgi:hypothetical protein
MPVSAQVIIGSERRSHSSAPGETWTYDETSAYALSLCKGRRHGRIMWSDQMPAAPMIVTTTAAEAFSRYAPPPRAT